MQPKRYVEWDEVHYLAMVLAAEIKSTFRPNAIVAVGRGGMVPAAILSHRLDVSRIFYVPMHYTEPYSLERAGTPWSAALAHLIDNELVLVVDDVWETGASIMAAQERVRSAGTNNVRSAVLHFKPGRSRFDSRPSFYGQSVPDEQYIVYPWEVE